MPNDWFARYGTMDPLPLEVAAGVLCGVDPDLTWRPGDPAERRDASARRDRTKKELCAAIDEKTLPADGVRRYQIGGDRFVSAWGERGFTRPEDRTDWSKTTIRRADLATWAENEGRPAPFGGAVPGANERPVGERERRTLLAIIRALASYADVDLIQPHAREKEGDGIADILASKIKAAGLADITRRTVADKLTDARDLADK